MYSKTVQLAKNDICVAVWQVLYTGSAGDSRDSSVVVTAEEGDSDAELVTAEDL